MACTMATSLVELEDLMYGMASDLTLWVPKGVMQKRARTIMKLYTTAQMVAGCPVGNQPPCINILDTVEMKHKRIYVRVPLSGEAILSRNGNLTIRARTIDISQGGVAITVFLEEVPSAEHQIEILTEVGQKIEIFAKLVRVNDFFVGFQTLHIDQKSQKIIDDLVFEYQKTTDFIKQLDEFNLHKVLDEEGKEIEVAFEEVSVNGI